VRPAASHAVQPARAAPSAALCKVCIMGCAGLTGNLLMASLCWTSWTQHMQSCVVAADACSDCVMCVVQAECMLVQCCKTQCVLHCSPTGSAFGKAGGADGVKCGMLHATTSIMPPAPPSAACRGAAGVLQTTKVTAWLLASAASCQWLYLAGARLQWP
jgi:hypothetical protein